ncbi:MAG TPA: hypothetical protein VGT82_01925 [Ktedonobacteraceae bacterium]|nr:hypothetical protein [Ktedonobacteraceae bacterium]
MIESEVEEVEEDGERDTDTAPGICIVYAFREGCYVAVGIGCIDVKIDIRDAGRERWESGNGEG